MHLIQVTPDLFQWWAFACYYCNSKSLGCLISFAFYKLFNCAITLKYFVEPLLLAVPPACRSGSENSYSLKKPRAAPSPTPPSSAATLRNGQRQRSEHNSSSDDDYRNSPDEPVRFCIFSDFPDQIGFSYLC